MHIFSSYRYKISRRDATYTNTCTHKHTHTHTHTHTHIYIHTHAHTHTHVYIYTHTHLFPSFHTKLSQKVQCYTGVYQHLIYIYTHTHTHTLISFFPHQIVTKGSMLRWGLPTSNDTTTMDDFTHKITTQNNLVFYSTAVLKTRRLHEHILQRCPLLQTARANVWPTAVQLHTKLYSSKEELEKTTTFILQTGLWM